MQALFSFFITRRYLIRLCSIERARWGAYCTGKKGRGGSGSSAKKAGVKWSLLFSSSFLELYLRNRQVGAEMGYKGGAGGAYVWLSIQCYG